MQIEKTKQVQSIESDQQPKTLEQYLSEADCYLHPKKPEDLTGIRESILSFVRLYNLEEKFNKEVAENHKWRKLAESTAVKYHIQRTPKKSSILVDGVHQPIEPDIMLMIWSNGRVPCIKIVMPIL